jgi:co-chaperonin GroES (HSP10)
MLIPCGHRVLVKPDAVEETTKSGIVLMTETQKKMERAGTQKGTVVAVGPTAWKAFDRITVRQSDGTDKVVGGEAWAGVGDRIYYSRYGGVFVEDADGEEFVILNDEDVVGILRGEENE